MAMLDERVFVVIATEVLIRRFGAIDDPHTWLPTFERHRNEIEALAVQHRRSNARTVVVTESME